MNISGINLLSGILNKFGTVDQFHQTHFSHVFYCTIQTHLWFCTVDRNDWNWDTKVHNLLMCPQHTNVEQCHKKWGRWSFPCILTLFFWCCCSDQASLWTRPSAWSQLQTCKVSWLYLEWFWRYHNEKDMSINRPFPLPTIKYDSLVSGPELQLWRCRYPSGVMSGGAPRAW